MCIILFNSKGSSPPGFHRLSNFFGGVEFEYMQDRFNQKEILDLLSMLEQCDAATFLVWLKRLQPKKKWTPKKEAYWFTSDGEPIRGVLAQLIGTVVRATPTAQFRKRILLEYFAEQGTPLESIETKDEMSDEDKQRWMKVCLDHKFADAEYRALLLATGDKVLHEKPMRGKPNAWSYKWHENPRERGGDWLGKLLMQVRAELSAVATFHQHI